MRRKIITALLIAIAILAAVTAANTIQINKFLHDNDHVIWYIERFISDYGDKLGLG